MKKVIGILVVILVMALCFTVFTACDSNKKAEEIKEYTISFSANGGTGEMADVKIVAGNQFTLPECTFDAPEGKQFKGWAVGSRSAGTLNKPGDKVVIKIDTDIYAVWDLATYEVSFDANGGTGTMAPVTRSGSYTLPTCTFNAPTGKIFAGWAIGSKESTQVKAAGEIIKITADTVIYALWDFRCIVVFDENGGTGEMAYVKTFGEFTLPECTFTPPQGMQFKGWAYEDDGDVITTQTINITETIILYAIWENIIYNVTFNSNGGTGTMQAVQTTWDYELPECTFIAPTDKYFVGWALSATGDPMFVTNYPVYEDTELFAIWATAADFSEIAMTNFLREVDDGNYVISANGYLTVSVYQDCIAHYGFTGNANDNFVVMSVDGEAFYCEYEDNAFDYNSLMYVTKGTALQAADERLPSYFKNATGNVWDVFTNDSANPLKFISTHEKAIGLFKFYAGISNGVSAPVVTEVDMIFNSVNPSSVQLQATFETDPGSSVISTVTITFGNAVAEEVALAWIGSEDRQMPEAPTDWGSFLTIINTVFLPGYADIALPFPTFASYATSFEYDGEPMSDNGNIIIKDPKAGLLDYLQYASLLLENGFTITNPDEPVVRIFRKLIREETKCYSYIALEFTDADGITVTCHKEYEFTTYDSLDDINAVLVDKGFKQFDGSTLSNFEAKDVKNAQKEEINSVFLHNYDLFLEVTCTYESQSDVENLLQSYTNSLINDLSFVFVDGEIDDWQLKNTNGEKSFRYAFLGNNVLSMLFKSEAYITPSDTNTILAGDGFPTLNAEHIVSSKDVTNYYRLQHGKNWDKAMEVSISYDTGEACTADMQTFANAISEQQYAMDDQGKTGVVKSLVFYKESEGKVIGLDYEENATSAIFLFVVIHQE